MFNKILIANRGAIACRIIRTLKDMNIASVAVYAESDENSLHVENAGQAFSLGDGAAADTYLDQDKILTIAKQSGAEAIHPGYGFLSENPGFVERCEKEGIAFIGPKAASIHAFALKHSARSLAAEYRVPLIPGSDLVENLSDALRAAKEIGYPVILKSSAGGGGIGMQVCYSENELTEGYDSVVRLSENNFSDGRVFLEKYIAQARHIEVQVFGNGKGEAVDLGERDCTLQRRNQKVIEEAPAPYLDSAQRSALHQTATRLLAGVNYASAGTVEFIFDNETQDFYFLEVNTRLQVEHGVTEEVFGVDLVKWMIEQAYSPIEDLVSRRAQLSPSGHAIQARMYAENPAKNFQPSSGLISNVTWSNQDFAQSKLRVDHWLASGLEVPPYFDPMLAKAIVWAEDRETAMEHLALHLSHSQLYGIRTNRSYLVDILRDETAFARSTHTRYLATKSFIADDIEVLSPGTMTSIQDLPGRVGYWEIGVPPSGPFDQVSFRLGNELLGNTDTCAGLEITVKGPKLRFATATQVVVTGADIPIMLDGENQPSWTVINIKPNQVLEIGSVDTQGVRAYLLIKGGIQCPDYLGSKSTFALGQFGGHSGRTLKTGDILDMQPLSSITKSSTTDTQSKSLSQEKRPVITNNWQIHVIYGPHGAPDFFTEKDIETFFGSSWEVHYNSSRTGIRLIGPKPEWARETGGEAGMHPSNIHDNAYALGSIDFTGDMPVILGPDGPSLGGFVCPATVINADLWKLGQLRAGDTITFVAVEHETALALDKQVLSGNVNNNINPANKAAFKKSCILALKNIHDIAITLRPAGDRFLLIEFGEQKLDLRLRCYVYVLRELLQNQCPEVEDLTPGIRSLQVHYNPHILSLAKLIEGVESCLEKITHLDDLRIPSRIVHLPLSWDDRACRQAVDKYNQSVRENAPWSPDNIEFIRRINGLDTTQQVKDIVFNASYVVMGLGDVYLGAPVATPLDPRQRLVTTKYNPARTWTAENSVGIGGAYLCVYGMEGPGGYQLIGRTLQMWNRYKKTAVFSKPWLLRFFDQIRFFEVSHDELMEIRKKFPNGKYPISIEQNEFSLKEYEAFLEANQVSIQAFEEARQSAFQTELDNWRQSGQLHYEASQELSQEDDQSQSHLTAIESPVTGSVWQISVAPGDKVNEGQVIAIIESMKMEIAVHAEQAGTIISIAKQVGQLVNAGQAFAYLEEDEI